MAKIAAIRRVENAGERQGPGVLAVGGVRGTADQAGEAGGNTVTEEGAVDAGVLQKVLLDDVADGNDVTEMLDRRHNGNRHDECQGAACKLGQHEPGRAEPRGTGDRAVVDNSNDGGQDVAKDECNKNG